MFQTPKLGTLWLLFTSEHTVSGCLVNKPKRMSSKPDLKKKKKGRKGRKGKGNKSEEKERRGRRGKNEWKAKTSLLSHPSFFLPPSSSKYFKIILSYSQRHEPVRVFLIYHNGSQIMTSSGISFPNSTRGQYVFSHSCVGLPKNASGLCSF